MNLASRQLQALARQIADAYLDQTHPTAMVLLGSAAKGESDGFSDLDLVSYYEVLPTDDQIERARARVAGATFQPLGPRTDTSVLDTYSIDGIECQAGHLLVDGVERDLCRALESFDVDPLLHKKLLGLQQGLPLYGIDLVHTWQHRLADFPDGLARAMVEHYVNRIFPIWFYQEMLARRDAVLWQQQLLVESAQNILGILAGLNRRYYSTFQFKRMREFVAGLDIASDQLAERIEGLFDLPLEAATTHVEALVRETLDLVERERPDFDVSGLRNQLGQRQQSWAAPQDNC